MENEDFIEILEQSNLSGNSTYNPLKSKSIEKEIINNSIVGYDIILETTEFNRQLIHIFFKRNCNSIETTKYLKYTEGSYFKKDSSVNVKVYITNKRNKSQDLKDKIKDILFAREIKDKNHQDDFYPIVIEYLSDMIFKISQKSVYGKEFHSPNFHLKNFILPTILSSEKRLDIKNIIDKWYKKDDFQILLILGEAGVGKTTLAEAISNEININIDSTASFIPINSFQIKQKLKFDKNDIPYINLYDLYKAAFGENILNYKLFSYNLNIGNLFVYIDGIDELISKFPSFETGAFVNSIVNEKNFKNAKIIINCRKQFWDTKNAKIFEVNPLPFTKEQAINFFNKNFNNDERSLSKGMKLAEEFRKKTISLSSKNIYHPYALDMIRKIINKEIQDEDLTSKFLNIKKPKDFIISKLCYREKNFSLKEDVTRVLNLTIDEQVKVFHYLAIHNENKFSFDNLRDAILFGANTDTQNEQYFNPESLTKSFSSHPLITGSGSEYWFSYDFLQNFFKANFLINYLNEEKVEVLSDELHIVIKDCTYSSNILLDIKESATCFNSDVISVLKYTVIESDKSSLEKKLMMSGLFNLMYTLFKQFNNSNKLNLTKIIKELFFENDTITNLHLIDIDDKITFDFSDIKFFTDCSFNSFNGFWYCDWSSKNYFDNCEFNNLGKKTSNTVIPWEIEKFQNFSIKTKDKMDIEFKKEITKNKEGNEIIVENIKDFIHSFIKFFYDGHSFKAQDFFYNDKTNHISFERKFRSVCSKINLDYNTFIEVINNLELVEYPKKKGIDVKKVNINNHYKGDMVKYIREGTNHKVLVSLKNKIFEILKDFESQE